MAYNLRFLQYDENSILVEWPMKIEQKILQDVLFYKEIISANLFKEIVEVANTYSSLLIIYNYTIDNINDAVFRLKELFRQTENTNIKETISYHIPVCYDGELGPDLERFSEQKKLSKLEIIKRHSEVEYTVYFQGFLPGFLYLGGLDSKLYLDRKSTPNLSIKKGSVGIGGKQTGIYPQDSPGGWQVIGNSPIEFFNPKDNPPCFIKAGDQVKFYPITKSKYLEIEKEVKSLNFNTDQLILHD
ncbi:inhibitor of KinA [Winogradskyella epiphytica]|uniref:Inhibitor of KinA n=1 Tax=Winogradskyella epiphytica TaxID=262005 RepID=A0A2V4XT42_9FLAO|nr:5-oxoprolinase subunit PxpB [Winogradskyella epiphytica]PYE81531.1 inhibitor of KinA [Winogradskyella epiphytica]GGW64494.1 allophanate hydrolase [Winogradskyella epiphytica]